MYVVLFMFGSYVCIHEAFFEQPWKIKKWELKGECQENKVEDLHYVPIFTHTIHHFYNPRYPLVNVYSFLLKMPIEIVDLPINNSIFP